MTERRKRARKRAGNRKRAEKESGEGERERGASTVH